MSVLGLRLLGAILIGFTVTSFLRQFIKPSSKLAGRVRPYTAAARSNLGRTPDRVILTGAQAVMPSGVLQRLSRPLVEGLVNTLMKVFGAAFDDEALTLKLRQSGVLDDVPEAERAHEYRVRQVGSSLGFGLTGVVVGLAFQASAGGTIGLFMLGAIIGATRRSAGVGGKIESRRERMRVELYTINQLLAIYLRTSGSPVLAAQRLVRRGRGYVIDELDEALRLHARGMSASKAFERISEITPEPFAARTYKLLASGSDRGADLATALLSLSEDVREARRTALKRAATKRQGAMLIPILIFLAPVMLLFIAAPLPGLLLHH